MYPIRESRAEFIPAMPSVGYFAHRAMYPIKEMFQDFDSLNSRKIGTLRH
jgi:hypothetical protein